MVGLANMTFLLIWTFVLFPAKRILGIDFPIYTLLHERCGGKPSFVQSSRNIMQFLAKAFFSHIDPHPTLMMVVLHESPVLRGVHKAPLGALLFFVKLPLYSLYGDLMNTPTISWKRKQNVHIYVCVCIQWS